MSETQNSDGDVHSTQSKSNDSSIVEYSYENMGSKYQVSEKAFVKTITEFEILEKIFRESSFEDKFEEIS